MAQQPGGPSSAPIQVIPPGLLGHLQTKSIGKAPQQLGDTTLPVIDLREWSLLGRQLTELALLAAPPTQINTVTTVGFFTFNQVGGAPFAVPQSQVWWVDKFSVLGFGTLATDQIKIAGGIAQSNGAQQGVCDPDFTYPNTAAGIQRVRSFNRRGFWALPGDLFGCDVNAIAAAAAGFTLILSLRATPCPL